MSERTLSVPDACHFAEIVFFRALRSAESRETGFVSRRTAHFAKCGIDIDSDNHYHLLVL
ncbi:hypothetical protein GCM10020370_19910 [Paenibacillus hodogayensis]